MESFFGRMKEELDEDRDILQFKAMSLQSRISFSGQLRATNRILTTCSLLPGTLSGLIPSLSARLCFSKCPSFPEHLIPSRSANALGGSTTSC